MLKLFARRPRPSAIKDVWRNSDAVILIEFAYSFPILMALAFSAIELANLAITNMRISQIAMTSADNVSRALQAVRLNPVVLREVDVNDALVGARIQAGGGVDNSFQDIGPGRIDLFGKGRIILSSLQRDANNRQTIFWQRCKGELRVNSAYGGQGATEGVTAGFAGMGTGTQRVQAAPSSAIIFAEVTYDYEPLVGSWALGNFRIRREAAFYVRDDRDLSRINNPGPGAASVANCNVYNSSFT